MTGNQDVIYINAKQHNMVYDRKVTLQDIGSITCANKGMLHQVKQMKLHSFREKKQKSQMEYFSILKVIELIHEYYPNATIESIGEQAFIVEYISGMQPAKWWGYVKIIILCIIIFFGSAFTIMAFNNDVSVTGIFERFYKQIMGQEKPTISELEISYSIGIAVGILVFFNHIGKRKFSSDPTPIQVEIHKFKKDMDDTLIENADRKGHEEDVS